MKTLTLVVIILAAICCLQNCKKDPCKGVNKTPVRDVHDIPLADKSKIPYTGTDTLVYYSDAGDTATLYGQGKNVYYQTIIGGSGVPDCYIDVNFLYQHLDITFKGNNYLLNTLGYHVYMYSNNDSNTFACDVNSIRADNYSFYGINKYTFYTESVLINGKVYFGTQISQDNVKIIYNNKFGFIQIKFIPGKTWTLQIK